MFTPFTYDTPFPTVDTHTYTHTQKTFSKSEKKKNYKIGSEK